MGRGNAEMMAADLDDTEDVPAQALQRWREDRERARLTAREIVGAAKAGAEVDPYTLEWAQWISDIEEKRCCWCGMAGHLSKDCKVPRSIG